MPRVEDATRCRAWLPSPLIICRRRLFHFRHDAYAAAAYSSRAIRYNVKCVASYLTKSLQQFAPMPPVLQSHDKEYAAPPDI